jgi:integrase
MIALKWTDVDLVNRQLCIRRSDWNGQVTTPKGGRMRHVPMTKRLTAALGNHRHLRSTRVLCQDDVIPFTRQIVQTRAVRAARRAGLQHCASGKGGGVHILRHTFLFAPRDARRTSPGGRGLQNFGDLGETESSSKKDQ